LPRRRSSIERSLLAVNGLGFGETMMTLTRVGAEIDLGLWY
jgi:hypothetical protein